MGADGGSINKSSILTLHVENTKNDYKAKDDNVNEFIASSRWEVCKISNLPLRLPIVSDYLGNLYNKESVLEWLLCKEKENKYERKLRDQISHIKRIHDVVELRNLVEIKEVSQNQSNGKTHSIHRIKCVYGDDILGNKTNTSFVYNIKCGDVIPRKILTLNHKSSKESKCPVCNQEYNSIDDIIVINPISKEDIQHLKDRYQHLCECQLYHDGTKIKKRKKAKGNVAEKNMKKQKVNGN